MTKSICSKCNKLFTEYGAFEGHPCVGTQETPKFIEPKTGTKVYAYDTTGSLVYGNIISLNDKTAQIEIEGKTVQVGRAWMGLA